MSPRLPGELSRWLSFPRVSGDEPIINLSKQFSV